MEFIQSSRCKFFYLIKIFIVVTLPGPQMYKNSSKLRYMEVIFLLQQAEEEGSAEKFVVGMKFAATLHQKKHHALGDLRSFLHHVAKDSIFGLIIFYFSTKIPTYALNVTFSYFNTK